VTLRKFVAHFAWGPKLDAATEKSVYEDAKLARADIVANFERWKAAQHPRSFAVAHRSLGGSVAGEHGGGGGASPGSERFREGNVSLNGSLSARGARRRLGAEVSAAADQADDEWGLGRGGTMGGRSSSAVRGKGGEREAWEGTGSLTARELGPRAKSAPRHRAEGRGDGGRGERKPAWVSEGVKEIELKKLQVALARSLARSLLALALFTQGVGRCQGDNGPLDKADLI